MQIQVVGLQPYHLPIVPPRTNRNSLMKVFNDLGRGPFGKNTNFRQVIFSEGKW